MKFGVCTAPENGAAAAQAGYDFIEVNVQSQLKGFEGDDAFKGELEKMLKSPIPCFAANSFIPGNLSITGPSVDRDALKKYTETVFRRANEAGIRIVVFGSGGARRIPEGFPREQGWSRLIEFGKMIAEMASKRDVQIVAEPLNKGESNVFNTVSETAQYVKEINHCNMKLLVDLFHWGKENDTAEAIIAAGPLLRHVHLGTLPSRKAPSLEPFDFAPFFKALKDAGYDRTVSIEAGWGNITAEMAGALKTIKDVL